MSSLSKTNTVNDIITNLKTVYPEIDGDYETKTREFWTLVIGALYDRITSDLQMRLNTDVVDKDTLIANTSTGVITGTGKLNDKISTVV